MAARNPKADAHTAKAKPPRIARPASRRTVAVPDYVLEALKTDNKARQVFDGFSPSHRREYIEWIAEAKRPETRSRRLDTMLGWLKEGKPRKSRTRK